MLELNHGHIVTVASSLGLFTTAGVEVRNSHFFLLSSSSTMYDTMLQRHLSPFHCRTIVQASLEP